MWAELLTECYLLMLCISQTLKRETWQVYTFKRTHTHTGTSSNLLTFGIILMAVDYSSCSFIEIISSRFVLIHHWHRNSFSRALCLLLLTKGCNFSSFVGKKLKEYGTKCYISPATACEFSLWHRDACDIWLAVWKRQTLNSCVCDGSTQKIKFPQQMPQCS